MLPTTWESLGVAVAGVPAPGAIVIVAAGVYPLPG